jgi:colanic acid/amylovoran biosynthesis protein
MSNKKKKILITHFPNLNNYGTGMMGLIVIQYLMDNCGKNDIKIYVDFNEYANIEEIKTELRGEIQLNSLRQLHTRKRKINPVIAKIVILWDLLFSLKYIKFDKVIVLGGDDISEFYGKYDAAIILWDYWRNSFFTKVYLLGQTMGPFNYWWNKVAVKLFTKRLDIYARDRWTVDYMKDTFNCCIHLSADIALHDLPLQQDKSIEKEILERYDLEMNKYFTIVISGLIREGYYCKDEKTYINVHLKIIETILQKKQMIDKKCVILVHTFPPYAEESDLAQKLYETIPEKIKKRIILLKDRILQTRARFIIGTGLFTITGRMHPAVSSFQMGKPAVCLAYSKKYDGVIGESIGREDLIINANDSVVWVNGSLVNTVIEKVDYLLDNYNELIVNIKKKVAEANNLIKVTLSNV